MSGDDHLDEEGDQTIRHHAANAKERLYCFEHSAKKSICQYLATQRWLRYTNLAMSLSPDDIRHVARLARLSLSEEELTQYAEELSVIFDYVEELNEIDTDGVEETTQVTGLMNVYREDEEVSIDAQKRNELIEAFPAGDHGLLQVQAVFDRDE